MSKGFSEPEYKQIIQSLLRRIAELEDQYESGFRTKEIPMPKPSPEVEATLLELPKIPITEMREALSAVPTLDDFMKVFEGLSGLENLDVPHEHLLEDLESSGKFTNRNAVYYINQAMREGLIFEREPRVYAKT